LLSAAILGARNELFAPASILSGSGLVQFRRRRGDAGTEGPYFGHLCAFRDQYPAHFLLDRYPAGCNGFIRIVSANQDVGVGAV
jgi:hypothetical protein